MHTERIQITKHEAAVLYRKYKEHQNYSTPIDEEIQRTYRMITKGRTVIRAIESIRTAGLNKDHLPKLALARADAKSCTLTRWIDGRATMNSSAGWSTKNVFSFKAGDFTFPPDSFPMQRWSDNQVSRARSTNHEAVTPLIPLHLRPRRALQNYHVLWEAEWAPRPPVDPILLRRIGKADLWLVVAAWELTTVEQAALSTRI